MLSPCPNIGGDMSPSSPGIAAHGSCDVTVMLLSHKRRGLNLLLLLGVVPVITIIKRIKNYKKIHIITPS